jgi:hypothetical protein
MQNCIMQYLSQSAYSRPFCSPFFAAHPLARHCRNTIRPAALRHSQAPRQRCLQYCAAHCCAHCCAVVSLAGIPGSVEFTEGTGGLPTVLLKHACGASAQVGVRQVQCMGRECTICLQSSCNRHAIVMHSDTNELDPASHRPQGGLYCLQALACTARSQ